MDPDAQPVPALFVHAAGDPRLPDGSGKLIDYLAAELGSGYRVIAPTMPEPDNPSYRRWRDRIADVLAELGPVPVILIGHSFGGSVLLKCLADGSSREPVAGLFLVSVPWWGPDGWASEEYAMSDDFAASLPRVPTFLYHSRNDPVVPFAHLWIYAKRMPWATLRPVDGVQHSFTEGLPELVADVRSLTRGRAGPPAKRQAPPRSAARRSSS